MKDSEIAKFIGKSKGYISKVKSGKIEPTEDIAGKLAELMSINDHHYKEIIMNELMHEICDFYIEKGKSKDAKRFAVKVQIVNERLNN